MCHRLVNAVKIEAITEADLAPVIHGCGREFRANWWFMDRFKPKVGGYLIVHQSGKHSYEDADVFEPDHTQWCSVLPGETRAK